MPAARDAGFQMLNQLSLLELREKLARTDAQVLVINQDKDAAAAQAFERPGDGGDLDTPAEARVAGNGTRCQCVHGKPR